MPRGPRSFEALWRTSSALVQLACFHFLTADQVETFLFEGSALLPTSPPRWTRRILAGLVRCGFVVTTVVVANPRPPPDPRRPRTRSLVAQALREREQEDDRKHGGACDEIRG
jgi:hypothetical protein